MTTKSKKRVVLPTRPEPPNIDQILEDIRNAGPSDPVFAVLKDASEEPVEDSLENREKRYQQCRSYVEFTQRLQQMQTVLKQKCEELKVTEEQLEENITEMKERAS